MRVYVAGHRGMVGSAIVRRLIARGDEVISRTRAELDLLDQESVRSFLIAERPDVVVMAAAKVGGIIANNTYPAQFIYENLLMECNIIHHAYEAGVDRLLFLGSSCIYPREAPQPIQEEAIMSGSLEPTNEPYAIAKIAGIKMCESYNRQYGTDYRSVMPTNLYGPNDNFHLENSHVLPALIRRLHDAVKNGHDEVVIWGTGRPRREFLHVDDMADASLFVLDLDKTVYESITEPTLSHINVGSGTDITISELAVMVAKVVGFTGKLRFDPQKPDGTMRKLMDVSRLSRLGWTPRIDINRGIKETYQWFLRNQNELRSS